MRRLLKGEGGGKGRVVRCKLGMHLPEDVFELQYQMGL